MAFLFACISRKKKTKEKPQQTEFKHFPLLFCLAFKNHSQTDKYIMDIANKRIVITGATSGIGQQLMFLMSRYEGTKIIAVGRKMRNIPIAMNILPFKADLSQEKDIDDLFNFAIDKLGGIDMFISNAGCTYFNTHETAQWKDFEHIFKTNVLASIYATKKMLNLHMNSTKEFLVGITISSAAKLPLPGNPVYIATKSALDGFIRSARFEFPPQGKVVGIYPMGVKRTNMFEDLIMETKTDFPGKTQTPQEVAKAIIRGIEKDKKTIYTSFTARLTVYLLNLFPFASNRYLKKAGKR